MYYRPMFIVLLMHSFIMAQMVQLPRYEFLRKNISFNEIPTPDMFIINDINNDGASDLCIRSFDGSDNLNLIKSNSHKLFDTSDIISISPSGSKFGYSVTNIGSKLIVTCPGFTYDMVNEGAFYIFSLDSVHCEMKQTLKSNYAQIAACSDVDGDKLPDIIVSSQRLGFSKENSVLIYHNLGNDSFPQNPDTFKNYTSPIGGRPATPVVLVNFFKEGVNSIAICSREKIEIFSNFNNELDTTPIWNWVIPDSICKKSILKSSEWGCEWQGSNACEAYYTTACKPADFNNDGFKDLVVAFLPDSNSLGTACNLLFNFRAYVFFGNNTGLPATPDVEFMNIKCEPCVGKFNSDTLNDLAISYITPHDSNSTNSDLNGKISIYFGKALNFGKKPDAIISTNSVLSLWKDGPSSISQHSYTGIRDFGKILNAVNLNNDRFDELVIFETKNVHTPGSGFDNRGFCFFMGGADIDSLPDIPLPGAVKFDTTTNTTTADSLWLNWHPSPNATEYFIRYFVNGDNQISDSTRDTSILLKNLANGKYHFYISPKNKAGWGAEQSGYQFIVNNNSTSSISAQNENNFQINYFTKKGGLYLSSNSSQVLAIEMLNLQGRVLVKENLNLLSGKIIKLKIPEFKSGLYLLKTKGSKSYSTNKITFY